MNIHFWGTRGSLPVNSPNHREFGGNTSCVEVSGPEGAVIFDAGSGLAHLGFSDPDLTKGTVFDIFFSHFHADHICGLPFFRPIFNPHCVVRLHSFGVTDSTLEDAVHGYLQRPQFPIGPDTFAAEVSYLHHDADAVIDVNGLQISAHEIPHPGGAHALKAHHGDKFFVYATDTEHTPGTPNQGLIEFMRDADFAIYDCTYDDSEFEAHLGWGHSTWQEGIRLAQAAAVKQFGIFHHDPDRTDAQLHEIEAKAQELYAPARVMRDFDEIDL